MTLTEVKTELWKPSTHFSEIYQSTGFKFAFLSAPDEEKKLKQCHGWVLCRDFLNDAVRNQILKKKDTIYGFSFDPEKNPKVDLNKMRMLVKRDVKGATSDTHAETKEMMLSAFDMLRVFERSSKIKPITKLNVSSENRNVYVFTGSADWVSSPFLISLYTFIIRLGAKKLKFRNKDELITMLKETANKPASYGDNDIEYLKTTLPYLFAIVEKRKLLRYEKEDGSKLLGNIPINSFHNCTGIVSLCCPSSNISELKELSRQVTQDIKPE